MRDTILPTLSLLLGTLIASGSVAQGDPLTEAQDSRTDVVAALVQRPQSGTPSGSNRTGPSSTPSRSAAQSRPSPAPSRPASTPAPQSRPASVPQSRPSIPQARPSTPQSRPATPSPAPSQPRMVPTPSQPRVVPTPAPVRPVTPSTGGSYGQPSPARPADATPTTRWSPSRGYTPESSQPRTVEGRSVGASPERSLPGSTERATPPYRGGLTSSTITDPDGTLVRDYRGGTGSDRLGSQPRVIDLRDAARPVQRTEVPRLVGSVEAPSSVRRRALELPADTGGRFVPTRPGSERTLAERDLAERYRAPREVQDPRTSTTTRRDTTPTSRRDGSLERNAARADAVPTRVENGPANTRRRSLEDARRAALERIGSQGRGPSEVAQRRPTSEQPTLDRGRARTDTRPQRGADAPTSAREVADLRKRHQESLGNDADLRARAQAAGLGAAVAVDVGVRTALGSFTGGAVTSALGGDLGGGYDDGYHDGYHDGWKDGWKEGWKDGHFNHPHGHYWFWHHWYPTYCGWWSSGSYSWFFGFGWGSWGYWPSHSYASWWYPWYYRPRYVTYVPWSYWYTAPIVTYHYTTIVDEHSYGSSGVAQETYDTEPQPQAEPIATPPATQPEGGQSFGQAPTSGALHRAALEYLALGDRAFVEGRYGDAVRFYAKAIEFEPRDGVLYLVLSDALFATGDYHYGAFALRRGLDLEPDLADVVDKRRYYGDPSDFERHLAQLEAYLEDHFLDDDARLLLAANYLFSAAPAKAVELLESPFSDQVAATPVGDRILGAARRALPAEVR